MTEQKYQKQAKERYEKYIGIFNEIIATKGHITEADVIAVTDKRWSYIRPRLQKYNLPCPPPIDSQDHKRAERWETLQAVFHHEGEGGGRNLLSLSRARIALKCASLRDARHVLDMMTGYGYDIESVVSYESGEALKRIEEENTELDERRQPEPLRVAGIVAEPIGNGWYQLR